MRRYVLLVGLAVAGCESVAPTDVTFSEGGAGGEGGGGRRDGEDASGIVDGSPGPADAGTDLGPPPQGGALNGGCTCTTTPGFGCCVRPASSTVDCTAQADCVAPNALWIGCQKPNTTTGESCCWNGSATRAASFPSPSCAGRAEACTKDTDCVADAGPCSTRTCNGVTIGACTTTGEAPACPPP